jgi:hypothetical protein
METAATATVKSATTVKATAAVEASSAVESATMEVAATEAFTAKALIVVEPAAMEAAIKATATVEAAMETTIKETITVPEAKPRSGTDENAAVEPIRAVIAVRRAGVGRVIVVAVRAGGRRTVIDWRSDAYAEADMLGAGVRSREKTNAE